jgi:hypothetical protein
MICRLRLDAGWYDPPGERPAGKRGPKPKKGPRQVQLKEWAGRDDPPWQDREVEWSGGERKRMRRFSRTGLWDTAGQDPVAIRSVLARDPEGALEDAGSLCTDQEMLPEEVVRSKVWHWSVAVTFEEMRAHPGMETRRQWSDLAIQRTTPVLLGLDSLVMLAAARCHEAGLLSAEETAWYARRNRRSPTACA